jgi:hypothetical protein
VTEHALDAVTGLPWRHELERFFDEDLSGVRAVAGPHADTLLARAGLAAAARGERVYLSGGLLSARPSARRRVVAHEVAHVLQQTRGARWAGRPGDDPRSLEHEAHAMGATFGAGLPAPARAASTPAIGRRLQGHESYEHRLLGDTPTPILDTMVWAPGPTAQRQQALTAACNALAYLGTNPTNINPTTLAQTAGFQIELVRLQGSGLQVTYGELNTMADYLTCRQEIDTVGQGVILPILQMIRESGYTRLNALLLSPLGPCPFDSILPDTGYDTVDGILESQLLDTLTTGIGPGSRDHYMGVTARNACHFAPFTWWRWQASYAAAVSLAQQAYQGKNTELARQAWLQHGYADHFLQDAFAAGHLINKTLIMQWFVDWAAGQRFLPVHDWDALKTITPVMQPGLWGLQLYSPAFDGTSNDPQTSEEQGSQPARMNNTGIAAWPGVQTQQQAYLSYLAFLDSAVCQIVVKQLHDLLNNRSVTASSQQAKNFVIWGDDTMLSGGTGAGLASAAAQMSQQSIRDILASGSSSTTWQQIFGQFPNQVSSNGSTISLEQWHAPNGELWNLCHSNQVFDSWTTLQAGAGSHVTDMGIVSVDQPESATFRPKWGNTYPAGWLTSSQCAACEWNGSTYVFYLPAGGAGLACVQASSTVDLTLITLPPTPPSISSFAAGVLGSQLTVVYVDPSSATLTALTSSDGTTWSTSDGFAAVTGVQPTMGVAIAQVASQQYVFFTQLSNNIPSLFYVTDDGSGWSPQPTAVQNSAHGSNPALATDGQILYLAFQYGQNGLYTGQYANGSWTGPTSRTNIYTTRGTSLAYVNGTLYLGYWATNGQLHAEAWNPGTQSWAEMTVPTQVSVSPVTVTGLFGSPALLFAHGTTSSQPGALSWLGMTNSAWANPAYQLGTFFSDAPPLLLAYGGATQVFTTVSYTIYQHAYDGTNWSAPVPVDLPFANKGRFGADVHAYNEEEIPWLAYVVGNGAVEAAAFDGKSWVQTPINATAGAGTGSVAVADFSGQLYAFYEQNSSVQFSVYDDLTGNWVSQGPVPGVSNPRSTVVTVAGDLLYLAYIGVNTATGATPTYATAFDSQSWTAPVLISSDNASSVSIAGFVDQIVAVYLGTNGILYGRWSGSGGTTWHNHTPLGQALTAPGMLPVDVTVGDDSHAQGLLALASWPTSGSYNGLFSREMTTTVT